MPQLKAPLHSNRNVIYTHEAAQVALHNQQPKYYKHYAIKATRVSDIN